MLNKQPWHLQFQWLFKVCLEDFTAEQGFGESRNQTQISENSIPPSPTPTCSYSKKTNNELNDDI